METDNLSFDVTNNKMLVLVFGVMIVLGGGAMFTQVSQMKLFSLTGSQTCVGPSQETFIDNQGSQDYDNNDAWIIRISAGCSDKIAGGGGTIDSESITDSEDGKVVRAEKDAAAGITDYRAWFFQKINKQDSEDAYTVSVDSAEKCTGGVSGQWCTNEDIDNMRDEIDDADLYYVKTVERSAGGTEYIQGVDYVVGVTGKDQADIHELSGDQGSGFEATFSMCGGGECRTDTIKKSSDSEDYIAEVSRNGYDAKIEYTGSYLGKLRTVEMSQEITPVYNEQERKTVLTANRYVQDYKESLKDVKNCIDNNKDISYIKSSCDNTPEFHDLALSGDEEDIRTNGDVQVKDGNLVRVYFDDSLSVEKAAFEMEWDIGWIGKISQTADPNIQAISGFNMKEQGQRTVRIPVENKGKASGTITTKVNCDGPLSAGTGRRSGVEPGETVYYDIQVTSNSGEARAYTCDVTATSDESNKDTSSFIVTLVAEDQPCSDCGDNNNGGGGDVVRPPGGDDGDIAWFRVALTTGLLLLIAFAVWKRKEIKQKVLS